MGTLKRGAKIGKVKIVNKIGEGQFAEVYRAVNKDSKVAVKVDKTREVKSLNREIRILKRLQNKRYFCKIIDHGKLDDGRWFCIMELLGSNLAKLYQLESLGWGDRLEACKDLLMGIRELHLCGYVHRDIKPANTAIRVHQKTGESKWALFDFGLGRKITGGDGLIMKERAGVGFRGSISYASINAHDEKDLSFHDDLWSWMYILIELLTGILPWKFLSRGGGTTEAVKRRERQTLKLKKACQDDPGLFFPNGKVCPPEIVELNHFLAKLKFGDIPDYSYLEILLNSMQANGNQNQGKTILCEQQPCK